jgi:hypothetical protein
VLLCNPGRLRLYEAIAVAAQERSLRQPEIEDLRMASAGNKDIRRLDIPVNDAARMRRIESIGDLDRQREQLLDR